MSEVEAKKKNSAPTSRPVRGCVKVLLNNLFEQHTRTSTQVSERKSQKTHCMPHALVARRHLRPELRDARRRTAHILLLCCGRRERGEQGKLSGVGDAHAALPMQRERNKN